MPEGRRWGRVELDTPRWNQRYKTLLSEGFCHQEASPLARGRINTPAMLKGRRARRNWYKSVKSLGLTDAELETRIDEMYDTHDWMSEYSQFYPEGGGEAFEEEPGVGG